LLPLLARGFSVSLAGCTVNFSKDFLTSERESGFRVCLMGPAKEAHLIFGAGEHSGCNRSSGLWDRTPDDGGIPGLSIAGLLSYHQTYGTSPSQEALVAKFQRLPALQPRGTCPGGADEVL